MPFTTVANQNIYYAEAGSHGLPIIFIHGAAGNHLVWGLQLRSLGEIARPISVDLPGHGRSDLPGRTNVNEYREVILGFLNALHIERAMLVGHSMGGAITQSFALAYPERVAALGLVGTGARLRVLPEILDGVLTDFDHTAELVIDNSYAPGLDPTFRARALAEFRACPAQVTHGDYLACNNFDIMPRVEEIHAPTIVICGDQDKMTPVKYSQYLASKIVGAQLVIAEGAGHSAMIERADIVNRALIDFVNGLEQS